MDQPYFIPSSPNPAPGAASTDDAEGLRSTVVQRLPQSFPFVLPQTENRITARQLTFHLFLLGLTVLTTTSVGALWFYEDNAPLARSIESGVIYSFTIIVILAAHELGHYIACRWYGVNATLPYFIPVPIPPVGTFGAFIKIKSPIPTRRALFDIGIAGPLAGFIFAVPAAFIAHYFAEIAPPPPPDAELIFFQSPLLFKIFERLFNLPAEVKLNPVMWAAWVGALMTSLNLLPVGQLDGGHVTYALFGRKGHRAIAMACYFAVIGLAIYSLRGGVWNWVVYALILTFLMRVGHPAVMEESEPLGFARVLVAVIGLIVFILCFMPVPISF